MAVSDRDREMMLKRFDMNNLAYHYQGFIKYLMDGSKTGIIDPDEYKTFKEMTLKRDVSALAHAYLSMVINFDRYWDTLQTIVGWDLMIQGIMDSQVKAKSNGEDTENEADLDNLIELTPDE